MNYIEENNIALELKNVCFSYVDGKSSGLRSKIRVNSSKNDSLDNPTISTTSTIENFSLQVEKGSFTTLLGPSGCGKSTLLRLISGFLQPEKGNIFINNVDMSNIPPEKRKIGMVFQDYALFPHMTVRQNILYGLKVNRKSLHLTKEEMQAKLENISTSLDLGDLMSRFPHEISGGQQQRVALARALILNPEILLMDEPLSSLDTKLREKVREELKEIQKQFGITTLYVTHDQEEALSLSDKIAVMNKGNLLQVASPRDIYFKPKDKFTADFIGRANFFEDYLIRPQWFSLNKSNSKGEIEGTVLSYAFLGDKTRFKINIDNSKIPSQEKTIIADLPTLETNFLEIGSAISLNIVNRWKI